ncbi:hypothetical protein Taro_015942 [Colocasia esculenta]|uniref:Uncharacterized protein n=1 Tax=Colocasia esculenta TaxID=4460 RepID=A0A843UJ81_COLES|nr:hypothetical protein [Colocasia esculenta]
MYPRELRTQTGSPRSPRVSRISAPPCARREKRREKRWGLPRRERRRRPERRPGAWARTLQFFTKTQLMSISVILPSLFGTLLRVTL